MEKPIQIIDSNRSSLNVWWSKILLYKGLFWALTVREMKTKYAHTAAGWLWILFNPTFNFIILLFVFGVILNIGESDIPRSVIVLTGLLVWQPFSGALQSGVESFARDLPMMKKIYFPKSYIPLSKLMYNALESGVLYLLTLGYIIGFHYSWLSLHLGYLLLGVLILMLMSMGMSLCFAGLAMRFRDIQYIAPLIIRLGFFASPVGYLSNMVPDQWKLLYYINPAAGAIDMIRAGLLRDTLLSPHVGISTGIAILLFTVGVWFFISQSTGFQKHFNENYERSSHQGEEYRQTVSFSQCRDGYIGGYAEPLV